MIEFIYNSETRSFSAKGFLSKNIGAGTKVGNFLGKNRTAVAGIGGSIVGAGLNRLRVKRQLKNQGVEKGSEEYKQRMRKATIGGAVAGGAIGLAADFGHRTYQGMKANGTEFKDAAKQAATGMGIGKDGRNKELRQAATRTQNARTGMSKELLNTDVGKRVESMRSQQYAKQFNPSKPNNTQSQSNKL